MTTYRNEDVLTLCRKLVMPRHIYVLAPPNRLVYELSRRTAKQRHSGWHSAEGQLVKSLSIATNELDEKDLKGYNGIMSLTNCTHVLKQAGTGPSRRHIQGSKIAKRHLSVKYSLLQYSKIENFTKKIFSKTLHTKKMTELRAGAR